MILPGPFEFMLGALAAWRIYKLIADDEILDRPRDWLEEHGGRYVETLLACPYCLGWWVSLAGSVGYYLAIDAPLDGPTVFAVLLVAFALSAAVVWIEILLDLTVAKKDIAETDAPE